MRLRDIAGIEPDSGRYSISHYEHLVAAERMIWGREAALRGASERLTPILMTALVTGLGLLTLAIGGGQPGREIEARWLSVDWSRQP